MLKRMAGGWQWIKTAWRGIKDVHTALWLLALVPSGALALVARFAEQISWTYSIAAGLIAAAAIAHFLNQVRQWRRAAIAESVKVGPEADASANVQPAALSQSEKSSNYFKNRDIYIRDLLVDEIRVIGRTFEDCVIHGPAVVGFLRTLIDGDCVFVAPNIDAVIISVWPRRSVVGVLLIKDCTFRRCKFRNIGVVDVQEPRPTEQIEVKPS